MATELGGRFVSYRRRCVSHIISGPALLKTMMMEKTTKHNTDNDEYFWIRDNPGEILCVRVRDGIQKSLYIYIYIYIYIFFHKQRPVAKYCLLVRPYDLYVELYTFVGSISFDTL